LYNIGFVYRWTDGHGETSIPPYNFVAGGININEKMCPWTLPDKVNRNLYKGHITPEWKKWSNPNQTWSSFYDP
jgi:hypothetical protein